jgi:hypothetical protein
MAQVPDLHMLTADHDDHAALTVALIKLGGSDRSEDNRNRIHINMVMPTHSVPSDDEMRRDRP